MKKLSKKMISVVLVLVMIVFTFAGCDLGWYGDRNHIFPEGYTCGFGLQPGSPLEYWWVETYEECLDAIELLKSHGSTFSDDIVLAYDEELFDVKYCFVLVGDGRHGERIKFGDNPFDRWAYDIKIKTYAFFDDVTIDELVYSLVKYYEAYQIDFGPAHQLMLDSSFDKTDLKISDWVMFTDDSTLKIDKPYRMISYCEQSVLCITTSFFVSYEEKDTREFKMTDECIKEMIESVEIINLKNVDKES